MWRDCQTLQMGQVLRGVFPSSFNVTRNTAWFCSYFFQIVKCAQAKAPLDSRLASLDPQQLLDYGLVILGFC